MVLTQRYWFRTAPATPKPFTIVAGGDTRNNRTPRRLGNQAVAKLRPLLVMFGGDFIDTDSSSTQWQEWMDDWQSSISADGRMYPIVATRGNHESNTTVEALFDTPSPNVYYALSIGGSLARIYTLNSEITEGGTQGAWLGTDLAAHRCSQYRLAQYHKPMRPHNSGKSDGSTEYSAWAQLFYTEGMDLVVESDSHTVKRTYPLRPSTASGSSQGFIRDDAKGTVYIGEGCWGAPLRSADDAKSWTEATASFNEVSWIQVHLDRMEIRTLQIDGIASAGSVSDSAPFTVPAGLPVWSPGGRSVIRVPARTISSTCGSVTPPPPTGTTTQLVSFGSTWKYRDDGVDLGTTWFGTSYSDSTWPSGPGQLGYGDGDEAKLLTKTSPVRPSAYFRRSFELTGTPSSATLDVLYDDGVSVWVNGAQVFTANIGNGTSYSAWASASSSDNARATKSIDPAVLRSGTNVVAAMVKQRSGTSSDLSFDLALSAVVSTAKARTVGDDEGVGGAGSGSGPVSDAGGAEAVGGAGSKEHAPPGARPTEGWDGSEPQASSEGACSVSHRPTGSSGLIGLALAALALVAVRRRTAG